jgi:hypothetical protein
MFAVSVDLVGSKSIFSIGFAAIMGNSENQVRMKICEIATLLCILSVQESSGLLYHGLWEDLNGNKPSQFKHSTAGMLSSGVPSKGEGPRQAVFDIDNAVADGRLRLFRPLRGGNSEPRRSGDVGTRLSMKTIAWSCCSTFLGALAISLTLFIYLVVVSYFIYLRQAATSSEPSMLYIAFYSLIGTVLSSFIGGACVGRLVPTHPTLPAAASGAIFVLFQLRQLSHFEGIPPWFVAANLLPFVPCCAFAARRISSPPRAPNDTSNAGPAATPPLRIEGLH